MTLSRLLKLQFAYALIATSFNIVSYLRIKLELDGLTNTNPALGIAVIGPVFVAVWAAHKGDRNIYIAINSMLVPLLLYAGIIKHFVGLALLSWVSILTSPLSLAVAINCFGVTVMTLGLIAIFRTHRIGKS